MPFLLFERRVGPADQVEPDTDDTGLIHHHQLVARHGRLDHGDTAQTPGMFAQGADHVTVVGAKKARLDQNAVGHAVGIQHLHVVGRSGVVIGRIAPDIGQR
jgi:hypothetical protein